MERASGFTRTAFVAAFVIGAGNGAANASAIEWHASTIDGAIVIDASARLDSDLRNAWTVLTDYDRYAEFIPGVRSSHVVLRRGRVAIVTQSVDATLGPLHAPIDMTYEITEGAPTRVTSHAIGECACTLDSTYTLTRAGREVRLDYHGRLVTRPSLFSFLTHPAAERTAARQFQALADEIELRSMAGDGSAPASRTWR